MSTDNHLNPENPYSHIRQKSNDDWLMYWMWEDSEFIEDLTKYLRMTTPAHYDPKKDIAMSDRTSTTLSVGEQYKLVIDKYHLNDDELLIMMAHLGSHHPFDLGFKILEEPITRDSITLSIPRSILKKDYIAGWDHIQKLFKMYPSPNYPGTETLQRNRAAENTQLIYAVFKARNKGLTFKQIFERYCDGKLNNYSHSPTLTTEESLERYYDKYRPDR